MRAFLWRIWKSTVRQDTSFFIAHEDRPLDRLIWSRRQIDFVTARLKDYFADLTEMLSPSMSAASPTA
jgi:hypothetical protein